jgi:hypothetical protein
MYLESLGLDVGVCHVQILCDDDVGNFTVIEFVAGARLITEEGLPRSSVLEGGKREMGGRDTVIIGCVWSIDQNRLSEVIESSRGWTVDQGTWEAEDISSNLGSISYDVMISKQKWTD